MARQVIALIVTIAFTAFTITWYAILLVDIGQHCQREDARLAQEAVKSDGNWIKNHPETWKCIWQFLIYFFVSFFSMLSCWWSCSRIYPRIFTAACAKCKEMRSKKRGDVATAAEEGANTPGAPPGMEVKTSANGDTVIELSTITTDTTTHQHRVIVQKPQNVYHHATWSST